MTYDGANLIFVLLQELACRRKSNLIDVLVHLFFCHTDTAVSDLKCLFFFVQFDSHLKFAKLALEVTGRGQSLHLLTRIHSVRYKFAKENLMIRIQELLYDGEYIFRSNPDFTF